uniref:Acylphosphatase-1 n=1 Tax=Ornithorhynchus anatinus TaxID=9258 RepID=A0A6I8PAD2_ORNAN
RGSGKPPAEVSWEARGRGGGTEAEGEKLGLVGWVQNTARGTVRGQVRGPPPPAQVRKLQEWPRTRGSPDSHIEKAHFFNERSLAELDYPDFQIRK